MAEMDDGAKIAIRRWGPSRAERIVISHGNGLAADAFVEFGAALCHNFEVVAVDLRNHGRSEWKPWPGDHWLRYISDFPQVMTAIERGLGRKATHGAFHSLSAACSLLSAAETRYPWQSLTLFEPPVMPPEGSDMARDFLNHQARLVARTLKRRTQFDDPAQLSMSFRRSRAFDRIPDHTLHRLAVATLRRDGESRGGPWRLACPAAFEAKTFRDSAAHDLWAEIGKVKVPVRIVCGDPGAPVPPVLFRIGRQMADDFGFDWLALPNSTHFMQLEHPAACAEATRAFAERVGD